MNGVVKLKYSNTHLEMFTNKYGTRLIEKWTKIFREVSPLLEQYEASRPKADELVFIQTVCNRSGISRREALWVIRELRRARRKTKG